MPLAIDHDDTQLLDFDSPHSDGDDVFMGGETLPVDIDSPHSDGDDVFMGGETLPVDFDSPHSDGDDVFMGGETLPVDFGETERVDSCDEQLGEGFQDWGKTQVVDEFEETEIVQDEDEDGGGESERTELVADEEGLVDDLVGEVGSGVRAKDGELVDPDASTDEDDGGRSGEPELSKKSFVSLPIAALPSSGFTDTCSMPEGNFNLHNHEKAEDIPTAIKAGCMETMPCSESALNIAGTKMNEIVLDHDAENSFRFIEGYSRDTYLYHEEETELRSELKKGKKSSQSPLRFSQAAAGLSYISSQEPGAQSQAIALDVVDKFLSVNDEGLSLDFNNENTDKVISLPIASVKRAQCFVRKSDKSTEGKVQVYDWIDSLEDEGGGELFSRRKNSFFDCKGSKEVSRRLMGADKKSTTEGSKSRTWKKLASLAKSKKKLFHELKKQTNTDAIEQLENCDVNDGVYSCGPATQMAAEAIQALGNSSPIHFELTNLQSRRGEVTSTSAKIKNTSRTCSRRNASTKKSSKPEGMTCSKLQKNIPKSRTKSRNSSRKQSSKLRRKIVLEDSTAEIAAKRTVKKTDEKYGVISVSNGENAVSVVGETMKNMVDKEVEKQPPVGAKCIVGTSEIYASPVAHRTRRSKVAELLNLNKTLFNDPCSDTRRNNLRAHRTVEMDDAFVSNVSVVPEVNKIGCNISFIGINSDYGFTSLPDKVEAERVRVEETDASHDPNAYSESKRTKVKNIDKENQSSDRKMYNRSNSVNAIPLAVVKPAIQKKKRKVFIRSFAEILDSVKRRKRSVSSNRKFDSDGLPSNCEKMQNESVVRTRPSLLFNILKPYLANDSHFKTRLACKPASDGTANTYSLSAMKHIVDGDNLETSKENGQCGLLAEDVNENTKPEVSPVAISQSGLRDSPPVCKSQESPRLSFRKSSSRSPISRELIRLEASYTSPSKLNDVRRRKDMTCFQVCFSNHLSKDVIKQQKKILKRLGIQDVSSSLEATHFVADKFVRTRNMLEAMAMGKPVVTSMWLESCGQASSSIDEKNYILRDFRKEKEIGFSMPVSLARAREHPLLQGKMVFIARNTRPNQELISSLVKIAGGQPLKKIELPVNEDDKLPDNLLILAGEEDFAVCAPLLERGGVVFSSELLLNGMVIQKLEYERHQLFLNRG